MIFLAAVDYRSRAVQHSCRIESETARHMSQVSRRWRYVALRSTNLWKRALDPDTNTPRWLLTVLQRCNFQPLALVSAPRRILSFGDVAKWTLLRRVFPEFRYLHVELKRGSDARCIRWLLSRPAPLLVDATIAWDSNDLEDGAPPSLTVFWRPLFGNNAPKLRRLHLINCPFSYVDQPLLPSLEDVRFQTLPGHVLGVFALSMTELLDFLRTFDRLTHLDLSNALDRNLLPEDLSSVASVRLPLLQSFTYSGNGSVFTTLNDRLDLPKLCAKHVFLDFNSYEHWSKETTDNTIARCLELVPILCYRSMGICVQRKRIYISFDSPLQYELAFDIRGYRCDDLPQPQQVRDILVNRPELERHHILDYFVCAIRNWIFQHPALYGDVATIGFGSTVHGVSTLLMLPLLWSSLQLEHFRVANSGTLQNPYLIDSLRRPRSDICNFGHLRKLTLPFYSIIDMHIPSDERDLEDFKRALQNHAPSSLLATVRHVEVAIPPPFFKHHGPEAYSIVERQVKGFGKLFSPWTVSWGVVDEAWLENFFYATSCIMLARDQLYRSPLR